MNNNVSFLFSFERFIRHLQYPNNLNKITNFQSILQTRITFHNNADLLLTMLHNTFFIPLQKRTFVK